MKKLIELDAALDALREVIVPEKDIGFGDESTDGYNDGIDMAITVVSGLPTVDVVPARHGRWKMVEGELAFWDMCSACGRKIVHRTPYYDFCPNCGAKMDEDGDT